MTQICLDTKKKPYGTDGFSWRKKKLQRNKILVEREIYTDVYMQGATKPPNWITLRVERKTCCRSKLPDYLPAPENSKWGKSLASFKWTGSGGGGLWARTTWECQKWGANQNNLGTSTRALIHYRLLWVHWKPEALAGGSWLHGHLDKEVMAFLWHKTCFGRFWGMLSYILSFFFLTG